MGRVYLHKEAPDDALKMFQLGVIAAQEAGSPLAVAVICANQAWAYAMMGREGQARTLIDRARDEFSRSNPEEAADWVAFFNENDDVYGFLTRQVDPQHAKYGIPALHRVISSYNDDTGATTSS